MQSLKRTLSKLWNEPPADNWSRLRAKVRRDGRETFQQHAWCLSTGRVGTNTIAALGELAPELLSRHEPKPLLFGIGKFAYASTAESSDREILREAVRTCRRDLPFDGQTAYLETSPQVTFVARQLLEIFPDSKFIHVVRHPTEVVRSGMRRRWYNGNPTDEWRIAPGEDDPVHSQWDQMDGFEKNVWSWAETNRWIAEFCAERPEPSSLLLKSEDLFAGHEATIAGLFQFLGCELPERRKIERVLGKQLNSQETGEFPAANRWDANQIQAIQRLAGPMMTKFGYRV